ncbi:hypothetical protein CI102_7325 [Trichoderma harzianum]|nr:hypothetical protein CI102_7325 [Trichoderma harzianum]
MVEVIVMRSTETVIGAELACFFAWCLVASRPSPSLSLPAGRACFGSGSPQNVAWCAQTWPFWLIIRMCDCALIHLQSVLRTRLPVVTLPLGVVISSTVSQCVD